MKALAEAIGLSQRRFIQVFQHHVGVTPKLYARLHRFQKVLRTLPENGSCNWATVSIDCGYFDQAHFNHDFKAFSGLTPGAYLSRKTNHFNHVPVEDAHAA